MYFEHSSMEILKTVLK